MRIRTPAITLSALLLLGAAFIPQTTEAAPIAISAAKARPHTPAKRRPVLVRITHSPLRGVSRIVERVVLYRDGTWTRTRGRRSSRGKLTRSQLRQVIRAVAKASLKTNRNSITCCAISTRSTTVSVAGKGKASWASPCGSTHPHPSLYKLYRLVDQQARWRAPRP